MNKGIFINQKSNASFRNIIGEPWDIKPLIGFFTSITLPDGPVRLNGWTTISDVKRFISTHLTIVKANNGSATFRPYYERLVELKNILTEIKL